MKRLRRVFVLCPLFMVLAVPLPAQVTVRFDLTLESPEFPDLNADGVIDGEEGSEHLFTANMIIRSQGSSDEGVQGWSCSLWNAGVDVVSVTVEGTVSAYVSDGGLVQGEDYSFVMYEIIDPSKPENLGRSGVVQAIILDFRGPTVLPHETGNVVGKNLYRATVQSPGRIAFIRYEDGLVGSGEPVPNNATCRGETVIPSVGQRQIAIGKGAVPEDVNCRDGVDNDNDGLTDCSDPDCRSFCGPEVCNDQVDNDLDGLVDCADPECKGKPGCREREVCDDGVDNDGDRRTDCNDSDCRGVPPCPPPEDCDDGIDNDLDGRTDCDDSECEATAACIRPEDCQDGKDNDRDGRTDCNDSDCRGVPPCPPLEDCLDGIDNDLDGRTDCDDSECRGRPPCPAPEDCRDGVDNDLDGLADCADDECSGSWSCGGSASGFDLILSAEGSRKEGGRNVVDVEFVPEATVEAITSIAPFPEPQPAGVQGWSIAVAHNKKVLSVESATIGGTDAEAALAGGFEYTEVVGSGGGDPAAEGHGGGDEEEEAGFISAVVLSFKKPVEIGHTKAESVARSTYRLLDRLGDPGYGPGLIRFRDGLTGSGEPVPNNFTVEGETVLPLHLIPLEVRWTGSGAPFVRGDANDDGKVNIADAIWIVNELLRFGPPTPCERAGDVNADALRDVSDAVYLLKWGFLHGPSLPPPFPDCGVSYGPKSLACPEASYTHCP